jgi:hypothetical protein
MTRRPPSIRSAREGYNAANLAAARIIAADPAKYPGVPQTWAALVIEKQTATIRGPLLGKAA